MMPAKQLYLIERPDHAGYDEYEGAVVVAYTSDEARDIHPSGHYKGEEWWKDEWLMDFRESWIYPRYVKVTHLGPCEAPQYDVGDVVYASFNAG